MKKVEHILSKYKNRIQSYSFNAPEDRESMDSILLDFMVEVLSPVDDFKKNLEEYFNEKTGPPKSKFMEEWEKFGVKPSNVFDWIGIWDALKNLARLIDKHKEDKRQS